MTTTTRQLLWTLRRCTYAVTPNRLVFARTSAGYPSPYTFAKRTVYTFIPSTQNCNKGHSLDTNKRQMNGMMISPIFYMHKMAAQVQLGVISKVTSSLALACKSAIVTSRMSG